MASPKMKAMNDKIPKPTMLMWKEGNVNQEKHDRRQHKFTIRGKTYLDFSKTKGANGNRPNKSIPEGYDFTFPKKIRVK